MSGALYLVGTPIGNLGDFSPRGLETLKAVDFIAAEDTRVTLKLLNHFDIHKPLVSYYEHNKFASGEKILARILSGETCALVTDAGMPAISDPGEELVALCARHHVDVFVIPGPSAVVSALAVSGLPTGRFCFEGFLSVNKKSRTAHLESLKNESRTMIFYEAPHKLLRTIEDMLTVLGDRPVTVARELTKLHEELHIVRRCCAFPGNSAKRRVCSDRRRRTGAKRAGYDLGTGYGAGDLLPGRESVPEGIL